MNLVNTLNREVRFATQDKTILVWLFVVFVLSSVSVLFGMIDVKQQQESIQHLQQADENERLNKSKKLKDWGSAAYYTFHLTFDPPSDFAFAAMGQRDLQPWKHRIRMLALEGQIYERDTTNPVVALVGRFDFAFLAAFLLPLVLIMLLYDLRATERIAGRYELLEATVGRSLSLWVARLGVRAAAVYISLILPLVIACLVTGTALSTLLWASFFVFIYTVFWAAICYWVASWRKPNTGILMSLMGIWIALAVVIPAGAQLAINQTVHLPLGADILLRQRETVNDAWDLPREDTFNPFFERHPEWSNYTAAKEGFEWPWYYAFQQVGDQKTELLTQAYRKGRLARENIAGWVSFLAAPLLLERKLQSLAKTDMYAAMAYEESVREFHKNLRAFYYPKLFQNEIFEKSALKNVPHFQEK